MNTTKNVNIASDALSLIIPFSSVVDVVANSAAGNKDAALAALPLAVLDIATAGKGNVAKTGSTVANRLGQQMHKAYKAGDVLDGVRIKEYMLPSRKRIDFIDLEKKIIYELKPNNPRAIKQGDKQLKM